MSPVTRNISERFWEKVAVSGEDDCWEWQASYFQLSHGSGRPYGRFVEHRLKSVLAHRFAYSLTKGQIGDGLVVRHTCDNPGCCNPNHLLLGTHKDNAQDRCKRGRGARGESGGRAKLTATDALFIRNADLSYRELRERFGVADGTIHAIKTRRNWKHV